MKNQNDILLQLQDSLYKMLIEFDKICTEHNLKYYISSGTLLGAIRHGGFIPWDDDIDIEMPRKDYETLINKFSEIMPKEYSLEYYKNTLGYYYTFIKIINTQTTAIRRNNDGSLRATGIYLDIFPIDGISNYYSIANFRRNKVKIYQLLIASAAGGIKKGTGILRGMVVKLGKLFNAEKLQDRLNNYLKKRPFEMYKYVMAYTVYQCRPDYVWKTKDMYKEQIKLKFNDHYFNAPCLPKEYLIAEYGEDYMQLPPEDKRRQHEFVHLDLSLPFKQFDISTLDRTTK